MDSRCHDRGGAIEQMLSVARRETLVLAAASFAVDDAGAAIASARLRWAIGSARQLIISLEADPDIARFAGQLDRAANRAQRWLVSEPPQSMQKIGEIGRASCRERV